LGVRTDFDRAIGVVPPGAVDVDAVIRRRRRTVQARQTWTAAGAGLAAVVVFPALVPFRGGAPGPVPAYGPSEQSGAPEVVHGVPSAAPTGPVPADIKAQLDAAFADRSGTGIPGAVFVNPDPAHRPRITPFISTYTVSSDAGHARSRSRA
jgi:hypothetical protein